MEKSGFKDIEDLRFLYKKNPVKNIKLHGADQGSSCRRTLESKTTILDINRPLKTWDSHRFLTIYNVEMELMREAYEEKTELLHDFQFEKPIHKKIWELHCDGLTSPQIEKKIKKMKDARKELTIRNIIKDLERELYDRKA